MKTLLLLAAIACTVMVVGVSTALVVGDQTDAPEVPVPAGCLNHEETASSISSMEEARRRHQAWVEYLGDYPDPYLEERVGNAEEHTAWVEDYSRVIDLLRELQVICEGRGQ